MYIFAPLIHQWRVQSFIFIWIFYVEKMKYKLKIIQLNLSTTATFGTEESGCCKEVTVVERF